MMLGDGIGTRKTRIKIRKRAGRVKKLTVKKRYLY